MKKSAAFHPSGSLLAVVGRGLESTVIEMVRAKNDSGETTTSLDKWAPFGSFGDDHHEYQDVIYSGNGKFVVLESATTNKTDVVEWESKKKVGTFDRMGPFAVHPGGDIIAAARNDQGGAGVHFFCLAERLEFSRLFLQVGCNISALCFARSGKRLGIVQCEQFSDGWYLSFQVYAFPSCELLWKKPVPWPSENVPAWYSNLGQYECPVKGFVMNKSGTKVLCPWPSGELVEFDISANIESGR